MNPRIKFRLWQAWWLIKGVLHGHNTPMEAIRRYRNTRFIAAYTPPDPPDPGDTVWGRYEGEGIQIIGRHIVPKSDGEGTVIP